MSRAGTQRPIADGLFTWPSDDPHLIGGRCGECGVVTFPRQSGCPGCASERMVAIELSTRGTLWTFTTQAYEVKEPYRGIAPGEDFVPFGLGYIELAEGVMVESRLTEADPEQLEIGMPMELVMIPAYVDADGTEVVTFAFAPAREA